MLHLIATFSRLAGLDPAREADGIQLTAWNRRQYKRLMRFLRHVPGIQVDGCPYFYGRYKATIFIHKTQNHVAIRATNV